MLEEEGAVMGGLLVGLNVIDANLCIKGEDLDSQVRRYDIGNYRLLHLNSTSVDLSVVSLSTCKRSVSPFVFLGWSH